MAFCASCGRDIGTAKFCPTCGASITGETGFAQTAAPPARPPGTPGARSEGLPPQWNAYSSQQAATAARPTRKPLLLIVGGIVLVAVAVAIVLLVSCNRTAGIYYLEYGIDSYGGGRMTLDDFRAEWDLSELVSDKDLCWIELSDGERYRMHLAGEEDQTGYYRLEDDLLLLYEGSYSDAYVRTVAVVDGNRLIFSGGSVMVFKK
ncbi:MAG: hypothetical protein LBI64_01505 [Coriobacteriales bacterium]|jgi:hypothetical protein|nr:hypothetical protein [Coriobacteriales bacterium]